MTKRKQLFSIMGIFAILGALALFTLPFNVESTTTTPALYGTNVPAADSTANNVTADVVGNKSDAAAAGAVTTTESIMAYVKQVVGGQITNDSNIDAILVDTGTTIPATITTAQSDLDILTGATGVNLLTATQASIDAIEADTLSISGGALPAAPVADSLAAFIASGGTALGQELPDSQSLVDLIGDYTGPHDGAGQDDNIKAALDLAQADLDILTGATGANLLTATQASIDAIEADTDTISGATLPAAPVSGSLATYISGGSTALGQPLPASMSLVDIIGDYTGAHDGAAQDDNIKASLDLAHTDLDSILQDTAAMQPVAEMAVASSAAVLTNAGTIFTIAGGPIEVLSLVSVSQTLCDATAATLQYSADPTVGGAITFSGASASLANFAAGGSVVLNMTALDTAPDLSVVAVSLGPVRTRTIIINEGIITTVVGTGPTTGTFIHYLRYRPLGPAVTVTGT